MQNWVRAELGAVDLGDGRREARLRTLVEQLSQQPEGSFGQACPTPADRQGAYRFFSNEAVEPEQILQAHFESSWGRMAGQPLVLVVQDTTSLDYSAHRKTQGLGPVSSNGGQGLLVHTALALTEEGEPLGLVHQESWVRDPEQVGKTAARRARPWREKESYKWQRTVEAVAPHQTAGQRLIIIGDRESDVYGLLALPRPAGVELLVRSAQNRTLSQQEGRLHDVVGKGVAGGTMLVEVGRAQERPARTAICQLRYRGITLKPPLHADAGVPPVPVSLWVVVIDEPNPPKAEKPLHWVLLVSWPIENLEQAVQCARWYSRRWLVERYHFVLKSGCRIEQSQLRERVRLERLEAVYAIVAWRLLALTYQARLRPHDCCESVLSGLEWKVLYAHHHHRLPAPGEPAPTLEEALIWVAKLGGYWGRKADAPPGVKVVWRGLMRLYGMVEGFSLATDLLSPLAECDE
jgi:hypothetical protein